MAASPEPERLTGRRAYDTVSAEVVLAIEETVRDTRHTLRNEIAAVAAQVIAGNLQSATEHAEVKACIEEMRTAIGELKDLTPRVIDLEKHDSVGDARTETQEKILSRLDSGRKWMIGTAITLAALIVAAASSLAAILT